MPPSVKPARPPAQNGGGAPQAHARVSFWLESTRIWQEG